MVFRLSKLELFCAVLVILTQRQVFFVSLFVLWIVIRVRLWTIIFVTLEFLAFIDLVNFLSLGPLFLFFKNNKVASNNLGLLRLLWLCIICLYQLIDVSDVCSSFDLPDLTMKIDKSDHGVFDFAGLVKHHLEVFFQDHVFAHKLFEHQAKYLHTDCTCGNAILYKLRV